MMQVFIICNHCKTIKGCDDSDDVQTCLSRGCDAEKQNDCKEIVTRLNPSSLSWRVFPCALCQYEHEKNTIAFASDE